MTPRPFLLLLTLLLVVGAIAVIEARLARPVNTQAAGPTAQENEATPTAGQAPSSPATGEGSGERIARKEAKFQRAEEIAAPTGFINTEGVSIDEARGEKVVLVDFWTYACYNCRNTQPHLNAWHEEYSGDGLLIIGVHTPEFGFEREPANVERAVREAGIEYPVVLDNNYATWNAYDQRYWPTMYLIDADGFIRYKHIGEGAYEETEAKIRELLAEKDAASG